MPPRVMMPELELILAGEGYAGFGRVFLLDALRMYPAGNVLVTEKACHSHFIGGLIYLHLIGFTFHEVVGGQFGSRQVMVVRRTSGSQHEGGACKK